MSTIDKCRQQLDGIDEQIIRLLKERQDLCQEIAKLKSQSGMSAYQPARHQEVIKRRKEIAEKLGVSPDMIEQIWSLIMMEAIKYQEKTLAGSLEKKA